ncbi:hypothetical protein A3A46_03365 [Candidatus Roizmanbacteria bacterium RIFCSPLOWO2_01_FULL_37_13]|uniref:GIY-YIG domain-containing protein n=1 Tax=Candidatus Roizmanbacteria bacterium RIFCSPHIGHO2_02_FULL_38_11 TaxID=1802039 RepID=A0A1F7GX88_9BACT|nr:MAG: hypothetical protein A3C25_02200 [Candidatus Roizmanbacteria bacterium RIFCSPHIGHO2_02_FULL_38_11]OGK33683.1 MAG: hypothetical protein A3F58_02285 [Candidatus Roizmanbacteria bacterium RIFCSPHIGHO2_12_FULL_37_9b]OGK43166.1 MAG: hypothetical protein A3A46_03365 [Candidatus Roizmanbacteria bacterium RIFCSPLOWO2_01_FULL_37_13]
MFYYAYVLLSLKDKNLYIGSTDNLRLRFKQHVNGKTVSLKNRRPLKLIYYEAFLTKKEALLKEKFYKSGRGHEVLYKMLADTFKLLGK